MQEPQAFFMPLAEGAYQPTRATQGPWDPNAMHGGPVAALLSELLRAEAGTLSPSLRLARLTVDFLGPLPMAELSGSVATIRPGRRIALLEASLASGGRPIATGRAWFIDERSAGDERPLDFAPDHGAAAGVAPGELPALADPPPIPDARPDTDPVQFFPGIEEFGYGDASEWRFTSGSFADPGPAGVWSRARVPLIAGVPMTGLARMLVLADAANGASGALPFGQWMFIPPGLSVTVLREPVGEWLHMAARTVLGDDGIGMSYARLADQDGAVAIAAQPLLISRV